MDECFFLDTDERQLHRILIKVHTHKAESVQFNTKPSSTTIKTGYIISCIYVLDSSVDKIKAVLYILSLFSSKSNDDEWTKSSGRREQVRGAKRANYCWIVCVCVVTCFTHFCFSWKRNCLQRERDGNAIKMVNYKTKRKFITVENNKKNENKLHSFNKSTNCTKFRRMTNTIRFK